MTELNTSDKLNIVAALAAVAPSGGGSVPFHLSNRLAQEWGIDSEQKDALMRTHIMTVLDDAAECGAITIHERL